MNEKDKLLISILKEITETFSWLNSGGTDITDEVGNLYSKISKLEKIIKN